MAQTKKELKLTFESPVINLEKCVMKKVFGYKVFVSSGKGKRWNCPFYKRPDNWNIRKGSVLVADQCTFFDDTCGPGINFWNTKKIAIRQAKNQINHFFANGVCVWKVQVVEEPCFRFGSKSRAKAVKLIERVL